MAERQLVRELELRPREQDRRWVHLLGPLPSGEAAPSPAVDREAALAHGAQVRDESVQRTYDVVADAYAEHYGDELSHKPFDTWLLDRIAAEATGPVADVGTGPGQIAARLASRGADVTGIDSSPGMIAEAKVRYPGITFETGDFRRLLRPRTASGWSAITAWYALVHLAESELPAAISALGATLAHGGILGIATHMGPETRHVTDLLGHIVDVDFVLHDPDVVLAAVTAAGLEVSEWYVRSSIPEVESETSRLYVLARKP
jgi:SAM-dependent methyltransferase